jgi:hypothetical protein
MKPINIKRYSIKQKGCNRLGGHILETKVFFGFYKQLPD